MNYIKMLLMVLIMMKYIVSNIFKKCKKSNSELIVMSSGAIGDNLIFADPFNKIEEMFRIGNKKLTLVCDKRMESFWKKIKKLSSTEIIAVDTAAIKQYDFKQFGEIMKKLRKLKYEHVILPMHHSISVIIAICLKAACYDAVIYDEWIVNRPKIIKIIYKKVFLNVIYAKPGQFLGKSYEELLWSIFRCRYSWRIADISNDFDKKHILEEFDYVVFAPYSNLPERSLSCNQITKITEYLINKLNSSVAISATAEHYEEINDILKEINNNRAMNLCGKTDFEKYLNLIKNCKFLIGTDSGSIHVAAAFNKKAVALCGLWSSIFLPYNINSNEKCIPITIRTNIKLPCRNCLSYKNGIRDKNRDCYDNILKGDIRICLDKIDMSQVYSSIDQMK